MTNLYVRSTDGDSADNGSTWALAKPNINGAAALDAAGDTIWVSQAHNEVNSGINLTISGIANRLICGNDAAEPPTALATTASFALTGGASAVLTINGGFYAYGITFKVGQAGVSIGSIFLGNTSAVSMLERCTLQNDCNSGTSSHTISNSLLLNCTFQFGAVGQALQFSSHPLSRISGGNFTLGVTPTNGVFVNANGSGLIEGLDFSALSSSVSLVRSGSSNGKTVLRDCKLPASWSGGLVTTTPLACQRVEMYNCDDGSTNYRLWIEDFIGSIKQETTIIKTSPVGATDGTTSLSWKMATNANALYPQKALRSPEIVQWNETTGSAITATIEVVHDSQGSGGSSDFTNAEAWIEVLYLSASGTPLGTLVSDAPADIMTAATDQTGSSVTWASPPGTPRYQKLDVTFTPQKKGYIHATVCMAGVSDTMYVDPKLVIT